MKQIAILNIAFFISICNLSAAGGGEEYSIIEKNHKKGLVNRKGRVLIPPEYEDLGWTNGNTQLLENVIGFKNNGLWGILNTKNEKVTEPVYTSLARLNESWIVASKKLPYNSKIVYGVINAKGKAEIAFQYHRLTPNNNQLLAVTEENGSYWHGLLDDKARPILPFNYDQISILSEELYEVRQNDKVAVFNKSGENLTTFSLDSITKLNSKYVVLFANGKRGIISADGDFLINPEYKDLKISDGKLKAQRFCEWLAFDNQKRLINKYSYDNISPKGKALYKIEVGEAQALIHASDSLLTPFSKFDIQEHFDEWLSVKKEGKSGVLELDGDMFLDPIYDSIFYAGNLFVVKYRDGGKRGWSIINQHKKVMTNQLYDEIANLSESFFMVKRDNYWGVVNNQGKEIIFCKYDSILQYTEGKLLVEFLGEDGILNMDGSWEILPQKKDIEIVDPMRYLIRSPYGSYVAFYPETKDFTAEYFLYKHGNRYLEKTLDLKYGLLDEYGKRVIQPEFNDISKLQDDSIYYAKSEEGYSFITKSGIILNEHDDRFQAINDMEEEFIGVKIDGRWGFVDINGKLRIANQYENVGEFNEGLAPMKILGRWGYLNKREDIIVQPAYDTVYQFNGGVCEVVKKGKFGLINAKGQITLECEYDNLIRIKHGGFLAVKDSKYGLVSKEGRMLILPKFDHVKDLNNGYVIADRKGKFGMLSNDGVNIIPMIYENLKYDPYNGLYLAAQSPEWEEIPLP